LNTVETTTNSAQTHHAYQGNSMVVDRATIASYESRIKELQEQMKGMIPMKLMFQGYTDHPPVPAESLYQTSTKNDRVTIDHWFDTWLKHIRINNEMYSIAENSAISEHSKYMYRPGIIAGSGPSLKKNVDILAKEKPDEIPLTSCLHNYAYFRDHNVHTEYWINLDAGPITIDEFSQGGTKPEQYYWDSTEDQTLVACCVSNPDLIKRWKGRILWFASPVPDKRYQEKFDKITKLNLYYNLGGNALGACLYHTRAILGTMPIVFIGADFAFDYTHKFHSFDTPYDKQFQGVVPCTDIFGNRVFTWPSYRGFANWFMYQAMGGVGKHPIQVINCTEGGIFGSFPTGNIRQVQQMALRDWFAGIKHFRITPQLCEKRRQGQPELLF